MRDDNVIELKPFRLVHGHEMHGIIGLLLGAVHGPGYHLPVLVEKYETLL